MKIGLCIEYADNGLVLYDKDNKLVVPYGEIGSQIGYIKNDGTNKDEAHRRIGKMLMDELESIDEPCGGYVLDIKVKLIKQ